MTDERYNDLMDDQSTELTAEEMEEGWHFCWEFDGLLIGPGWDELNDCHCLPESHQVYNTRPVGVEVIFNDLNEAF